MSSPENRNSPSLMDDLNQRIDNQTQAAGKALDGLANDAAGFAQRGSDATQLYIQHEPLKAVLYAAAAGAALVLVLVLKLLKRSLR